MNPNHARTTGYSHAWMTLDQNFTVIEGSKELLDLLPAGRIVWATNPPAERVLRPFYERVWRTGHGETIELLRGWLCRIESWRVDDTFYVESQVIGAIDAATLETLEVSLHQIASRLADEASSEAQRPQLRVV